MTSCQEPLLKSDDEDDLVFDRTGLLSNKVIVKPDVCQRGHSAGKRMQYARTVNLCLAFFALGLCFAIPTATLHDLQAAVEADSRDIEFIYTARYSGYVFGSIIGGILFDRYNRQFLLFLSLLATAVGIITMPFCTKVGALMACTAITGITMGFLDTGGNVWCLDLWGKKSAPFMQTLHFCFGLGAFVAPLVAEPFLSPRFDNATGLIDSSNGNATVKNYPHIWFPHQRVKAFPEQNVIPQHINSSGVEDTIYETSLLHKLPRHKANHDLAFQSKDPRIIVRHTVKRYASASTLETKESKTDFSEKNSSAVSFSPKLEIRTGFVNLSDYYSSSNISQNIVDDFGNNSSQENITLTQSLPTMLTPTELISNTKLKPKKPQYADGNQLKHDDIWDRTSLKQKTKNELSSKDIKEPKSDVALSTTIPLKISTDVSSSGNGTWISDAVLDATTKNSSIAKLQQAVNLTQYGEHGNGTEDSNTHTSHSNVSSFAAEPFSSAHFENATELTNSLTGSSNLSNYSVKGRESSKFLVTTNSEEFSIFPTKPHSTYETHTTKWETKNTNAQNMHLPQGNVTTGRKLEKYQNAKNKELNAKQDYSSINSESNLETVLPENSTENIGVNISTIAEKENESLKEIPSRNITMPKNDSRLTGHLENLHPNLHQPSEESPLSAETSTPYFTTLRNHVMAADLEITTRNNEFLTGSLAKGNKNTDFKQTSLRSADTKENSGTTAPATYDTETIDRDTDVESSHYQEFSVMFDGSSLISTPHRKMNSSSTASSWSEKDFNMTLSAESKSKVDNLGKKPSHVDFLSSLFATMCQHRLGKFEIAYVILGVYIFIVASVFLICLCLNPREPRSRQEEQLDKSRNITATFKISVVILMSLFLCLYVGIEVAVGQLLQTFTVKQYLQLPESTGYFMTYSFWGSFALARGLSIALSIKFSGLCLLFMDLTVCFITSVLLVAGANKIEALLWVGIVVLAFGMAPIFPAAIAWIERYIPITNKIASGFILGAALGEMTIPLIIYRFIYQEPMVLMYVNVIVNILCLVTFVALWFLASHQGEKYKTKIDRTMYQLANFDDVEDGYELCYANSRWQNDYNSHILLKNKLVGKT